MITRNIARVTGPEEISFAGSPSFIQVEALDHASQLLEVRVSVGAGAAGSLVLTRPGGDTHTFTSTGDLQAAGGNVFYLNATDQAETAQNLREAILQDSTLSALFDAVVPFVDQDNGTTVLIRAKAPVAEANFTAAVTGALALTWVRPTSSSGDLLLAGESQVKIDAEIYRGGEIPVLTLSKFYDGAPIWFRYGSISEPKEPARPTAGWFDPLTWSEYKAALKLNGKTSPYFFVSDPFYVIQAPNLSGRAASEFFADPFEVAVPQLSNGPTRPLAPGQKIYVNLVARDLGTPGPWSVRLSYWKAGEYLTGEEVHPVQALALVNTWEVDPWENVPAGSDEVRAEIVNPDGAAYTYQARYLILPECVFEGAWFAFLNDLGGWDSINFGAFSRYDDRVTWEAHGKAITPANLYESEGVAFTDLERIHTLESGALSDQEAEWAAEFAASPLILDSEGRRVILQEYAIPGDGAKNFKKMTIKYRYADSRALYK